MHKIKISNGRQLFSWRLFAFIYLLVFGAFFPAQTSAHQSPNTLVFLDAGLKKINLELEMPLTELELAFGNNITKNPETLIEKFGPQLNEYLKAHIHAYLNKANPWLIDIKALKMAKGHYAENGMDYWELIANVQITPQASESTRMFFLDYDVIMHQVINHVAFLTVRSDWEAGSLKNSNSQPMVIAWNSADNVIYPLKIDLKDGSWIKGFKSMVSLGIEHIKDGTDHLLFLLTLILPATLIPAGKRWAETGTLRYSLLRIFKIVTAFTIGHSVTLLIGSFGLVHFPAKPIEILIAISILVSAIHALRPVFPGKEIYIAGGFGLIHGMAFAQTLANLNLDGGSMVLSILGFNLGIEVMQLFVIAVTIPWLVILSRGKIYNYVRIIGALFAAIASIGWIMERITAHSNLISSFVTSIAGDAYLVIIGLSILSALSLSFRKTFHTQV